MNRQSIKKITHSGITKKFVSQCAVWMILWAVTVFGVAFFGALICTMIHWDYHSLIYKLLSLIRDCILIIIPTLILAGWIFIFCTLLRKSFSYFDKIVCECEKLVNVDNGQINLPPEMKDIQDNMNALREDVIKNRMLAKEAEQRKNDLVLYLAHDLKTPLTSIIGYLTLLNAEPDISTENRAKYIGISLDKANRLEQLINEFFEITRFNLQTLTLEPERINLSLMLEQTMSEFLPIFKEHNLTSSAVIQPNVEMICDPDKLERVFDNLLRNAVNYSYKNSEVSLAMIAENGKATVEVRNHGKTIPKEKLEKIFEQFFRMDTARQSDTGGAGLGLAIAKEIVARHGGSISASSENENTVFTVILPLVAASANDEQTA